MHQRNNRLVRALLTLVSLSVGVMQLVPLHQVPSTPFSGVLQYCDPSPLHGAQQLLTLHPPVHQHLNDLLVLGGGCIVTWQPAAGTRWWCGERNTKRGNNTLMP